MYESPPQAEWFRQRQCHRGVGYSKASAAWSSPSPTSNNKLSFGVQKLIEGLFVIFVNWLVDLLLLDRSLFPLRNLRCMSIINRLSTKSPRILAATARLCSIQSQLQSPSLSRTMATSSSIPKIMKGVLIEKTGGTEVLQYKTDLPVPTPKNGEILVKNDYIGINYIDT